MPPDGPYKEAYEMGIVDGEAEVWLDELLES